MTLAPRVVVVHRRTEYEQLLQRHGSRGQAAFFLDTRGRSITEVDDSIPAPIAAVIDRGLKMNKADRWASASEMRQALIAAAREAGIAIPASLSAPAAAPRPVSRISMEDIPQEAPTRATHPMLPSPWLGDEPADGVNDAEEASLVPVFEGTEKSTIRPISKASEALGVTSAPIALVTNRCLFDFDRARARFRLASVHPGHSVAEVSENTGFEFDHPTDVPLTPAPSAETLHLMRTVVAPMLAEVYPEFARRVFNIVMPREGGASSTRDI